MHVVSQRVAAGTIELVGTETLVPEGGARLYRRHGQTRVDTGTLSCPHSPRVPCVRQSIWLSPTLFERRIGARIEEERLAEGRVRGPRDAHSAYLRGGHLRREDSRPIAGRGRGSAREAHGQPSQLIGSPPDSSQLQLDRITEIESAEPISERLYRVLDHFRLCGHVALQLLGDTSTKKGRFESRSIALKLCVAKQQVKQGNKISVL